MRNLHHIMSERAQELLIRDSLKRAHKRGRFIANQTLSLTLVEIGPDGRFADAGQLVVRTMSGAHGRYFIADEDRNLALSLLGRHVLLDGTVGVVHKVEQHQDIPTAELSIHWLETLQIPPAS